LWATKSLPKNDSPALVAPDQWDTRLAVLIGLRDGEINTSQVQQIVEVGSRAI
jgi:hypothetical protein